MRSERERLSNKPIELMVLPCGKKISTKVLPMGPALDWVEQASGVMESLQALGQGKGDRREVFARAIDLVADYSPEVDGKAVRDAASWAQVVDALYVLWEETDPLAAAERNQQEAIEKQLALAEKAGPLMRIAGAAS